MRLWLLATVGCFFCVLPPAALAAEGSLVLERGPVSPIMLSKWEPRVGDRFAVDTKTNMGYLVHEDMTYTSFPIASGRRSNVWYIGRYYNAATPNWTWTALAKEIKGDRVTFGEDGLFIRLFHDGEETPYGIHAYRKDEMNQPNAADRYRSMGCIVPRKADLALIEKTFDLNKGSLTVVTSASVKDPYTTAFAERRLTAMNW